MYRRVAIVALFSMVVSFSTQAAVYKWVDENGQVVYSQTAPPSSQAEVIAPPPPPPKGSEEPNKRLQEYQQQQQDARDDKAVKAQQEREQQLQMEARKKVCEAAQHNLKVLEGNRDRVLMKDGQVIKMSAAEREAAMVKAQKDIAEFCRDLPAANAGNQ